MNMTKALLEGTKVWFKELKYNPKAEQKMVEILNCGILIKIFRSHGTWMGLVQTEEGFVEVGLTKLSRTR